MPEEKKETQDPGAPPKEENKETKPTPQDEKLQKAMDEIETLKKQVSNNSRVHEENQQLRQSLEKVALSLQGKTEKEKDAELEKDIEELVADGYEEKSVRKLLTIQAKTSQREARKVVAPLVTDMTEDLIESDSEVDIKIMEKYASDIKLEFDSYAIEMTPRKIKRNLKKAYNAVKERLAEKAKKEKPEDDRDKKIKGQSPEEQAGKKPEEAEKEFIEGIRTAGVANSHFI